MNKMTSKRSQKQREQARKFRFMVEMTKSTPLIILEEMLVEMFDEGIKQFIKREKKTYPKKSKKQILIDMYKLKEVLKGK